MDLRDKPWLTLVAALVTLVGVRVVGRKLRAAQVAAGLRAQGVARRRQLDADVAKWRTALPPRPSPEREAQVW